MRQHKPSRAMALDRSVPQLSVIRGHTAARSLIFLLHCGGVFCFSTIESRSNLSLTACEPRLACGGPLVLHNLSENIRQCYRHAEDCARKAADQADPKAKQNFLDLEQRWLSLARSFEFSELITGFKPAEPEPVAGS
jgi:hypothetical protein